MCKKELKLRPGVPEMDPEIDWGFRRTFRIDKNQQARVLITGADSYIGTSFEEYVFCHYPNIEIHTLDMKQADWRENSVWTKDWDTIFHVAGVAHADIGKATDSEIERYYRVNTDLAIDVAKKGKKIGVRQFIFMSSMIIYGNASYITADTLPAPDNFYGDSKWQADKAVRALSTNEFRVAVLRTPMVYGNGSKGNYPTLAKLAKKAYVFPEYNNQRSMIYIENLCEFISLLVLSEEGGVYFPQNSEYSNTSKLMGIIAKTCGKRYSNSRVLSHLVEIAQHVPGKLGNIAHKAFGNSYYDNKLSIYEGLDYQMVSLEESIRRTESNIC